MDFTEDFLRWLLLQKKHLLVWSSRPTTSQHYILCLCPVFIIPCGRNFGGQAWYVEAKMNFNGVSFLAWLLHSCPPFPFPCVPVTKRRHEEEFVLFHLFPPCRRSKGPICFYICSPIKILISLSVPNYKL